MPLSACKSSRRWRPQLFLPNTRCYGCVCVRSPLYVSACLPGQEALEDGRGEVKRLAELIDVRKATHKLAVKKKRHPSILDECARLLAPYGRLRYGRREHGDLRPKPFMSALLAAE